MNALNSQVANLNINQCTVRRDVIDALFRQPLSTATLPFVNHTIPGTIYAVDYDLGKNNYAYKDNGYQNSSGQAGGAVWNSGGQYRNDGVDIELCSDSLSNGYDVGWIESGEFLTFTVTVVESGVYDIGIRVAANAPGGLTRLMFDGFFADNFLNIPITGGWQLWQNIPAGQVQLTAGIHTFSAYLFSNVFNVNCFIFSKTSTSVEQEYLIPSRFELVQNYPNPFNPTTTIEFTLAERGNARLMVFNMLGQEIATLFDQVAEPARLYRVVFDGSKLTSGVYAVRLQTGKEYLSQRMMLLK
jgi:hypothetical protein